MPSPGDFTVRPLRESDFHDLRETYYRLYDERDAGEPIGITLFSDRPSMDDEVAWFDRHLRRVSDGHMVFVVAEVDGHVVGSCTVDRAGATDTSEEAHVGHLGILVRKGYRGRGIGTALLERALAEARSKFDVVFLSVFSVNRGAQQLYRRFGFSVCGHLPRVVKRGNEYFDEEQMVLVFPDRPTTARAKG